MPDDLRSAFSDWLDRLETNGFVVRGLLQPPASDAEIAELERASGLRLTDEIAALYRLNNGQRLRPSRSAIRDHAAVPWPPGGVPLFGFYEFLDTREAAATWQGWKDIDVDQGPDGMADMARHVTVSEPTKVKRAYWLPGWLPFAQDGGGNALAFDVDPEPEGAIGQVIVIGSDEDHRRVFAPSIGVFLRRLVAEWQAGRVEIEEDDPGRHYYDLPFLRGVDL